MNCLRVLDVYGEVSIISQSDYFHNRTQIPLRFSNGEKLSDGDDADIDLFDCLTIHRNNIKEVLGVFNPELENPRMVPGGFLLKIVDNFVNDPVRCPNVLINGTQCCFPVGHEDQSRYAHGCTYWKSDEKVERIFFLIFAKLVGTITVLHHIEVGSPSAYDAIVGAMMHLRQSGKGDYCLVDLFVEKPDVTLLDTEFYITALKDIQEAHIT